MTRRLGAALLGAVLTASTLVQVAAGGATAATGGTSAGVISTVVGGIADAPATASDVTFVSDATRVGTDAYVAAGPTLRRVGADGVLRVVAGTGYVGTTDVSDPASRGLGPIGVPRDTDLGMLSAVAAEPSGTVLLLDSTHGVVLRYDPAADALARVALVAPDERLVGQADLAVSSTGTIAIPYGPAIRLLDPDGRERSVVPRDPAAGWCPGPANSPYAGGAAVAVNGLTFDPTGRLVFTQSNGLLCRQESDGTFIELARVQVGLKGAGLTRVAVLPDGRTFVGLATDSTVQQLVGGTLRRVVASTGLLRADGATGLLVTAGSGLSSRDVDSGRSTRLVDRSFQPAGDSPDGTPARSAHVTPDRVAALSDGTVLLTSIGDGTRLRRVEADGTLGTALVVPQTSGGLQDVAVGPGDHVVVTTAHAVLRDGVVIAGRLTPAGASQDLDGTPAVGASLDPSRVAVDPTSGRVLFTDNTRVRTIDDDGNLRTLAGTEADGDTGDGGPATSATLSAIADLDVGPDGTVVLAANRRLRAIDPVTGVIRAVTSAQDDASPVQVTVAPTGAVLVRQPRGRIDRVTSAGTYEPVAGAGLRELGDGQQAGGAALTQATGIAAAADGDLLVADTPHGRVRRITAPLDAPHRPAAPVAVRATPDDGAVALTWTAPASDLPVTSYAITGTTSTGAAGGSCRTTATTCTVRPLGNGTTYAFAVTALSDAGPSDPTTVVATPQVDTTPPVVRTAALPVVTLGTGLRFSYDATGRYGVSSFDVRLRRSTPQTGLGGFVTPDGWQGTTARSVALTSPLGSTTCFSVRAHGVRGTTSAWSAERCTTVPLDDRQLAAGAGWVRAGSAGAYAATLTTATRSRAVLTRELVARRLYVVAATCPSCGAVDVLWNGAVLRRLDLRSGATRQRVVLPVADLGRLRSGTVVLRTADGRRAFVDGLAGPAV